MDETEKYSAKSYATKRATWREVRTGEKLLRNQFKDIPFFSMVFVCVRPSIAAAAKKTKQCNNEQKIIIKKNIQGGRSSSARLATDRPSSEQKQSKKVLNKPNTFS